MRTGLLFVLKSSSYIPNKRVKLRPCQPHKSLFRSCHCSKLFPSHHLQVDGTAHIRVRQGRAAKRTESGPTTSPGRLAFSTDAGDGKRRIFAIGNYVHQRLLRPLHDFLMRVLACLPTDGTFDQLRPLDRLKGKIDVYSFDLKSATDRWPL